MRRNDLLRQAKLISPYVSGKSIAFIGDMDGASALLGLLVQCGWARPAQMLVLDFDERVLDAACSLAYQYGFASWLETRPYNVFDPVDTDLVGQFDWFYTNPPYGSSNTGASARLFITRGCELVRPGGEGCIILPDDGFRPWTQQAMLETQRFLTAHGWMVTEKLNQMHGYQLDDDPGLASSLVLVKEVAAGTARLCSLPHAGRRVDHKEIPVFYGRSVAAPYPRYINMHGQIVCDANRLEQVQG